MQEQPNDQHSLEPNTVRHRNAYYSPHSHRGLTTHLILKGQLAITYPKEENPEKKTYGVGDRVDVGAGVTHEVWMGLKGVHTLLENEYIHF